MKTFFSLLFTFLVTIAFSQTTNIGGVINAYTSVSAFNPCTNKLTVQDANSFKTGDTVLLIQMKGALIDTSNNASFGNIKDYRNSGNYEFNYIKSKSANVIELENATTRNYDLPNGRVQLIRVPYYNNVVVTSSLTCLPWDGYKGGVLVFNVKNDIQLQQNIDVSGKGFHGGIISNNPDGGCGTGSPDFYYPLKQPGNLYYWNSGGAKKGEGIAEVSEERRAGKGKLGNGGGGGNKHNSGGGGGANYSAGGVGGNGLGGCQLGGGGIGGADLSTAYKANKIYLGGGGGRGDDNNGVGTVGVNGGGIIIISANTLDGANKLINANGLDQLKDGTDIADGAGGGGAGGVILLNVQNFTSKLTLQAAGGKGGDQRPYYGCVGPGGGGSGGYIASTGAAFPANITTVLSGGKAGIFYSTGSSCTNTSYGATAGAGGATAFNITLPIDNIQFKNIIDSIRISYTPVSCTDYDFKGLVYPSNVQIKTWQWYIDGLSGGTNQTASGHFNVAGNHTIKLVSADANSCTDSFNIVMNSEKSIMLNAGNDSIVCKNEPFVLHGKGTAIATYSWTPANIFKDNTVQNPTGTVGVKTKIYVTAKNTLGCVETDSLNIDVYSPAATVKTEDTSICPNTSVQLSVIGRPGTYSWTPVSTINNPGVSNPVVSPTQSTTYYVTFPDMNGCNAKDSIKVSIRTLSDFTISPDQSICGNSSPVQLNAGGGNIYTWSPASLVSNPNIHNPSATATETTTFNLVIKETTCNTSASLHTTVSVSPAIKLNVIKSNDVDCSNGSAQLTASGAFTYTWTPSAGLNNSFVSNPIASPHATQKYTVKGTDTNGCSASESITVLVNFVNTGLEYYIPNAFTPNGDGVNDCFGIKNWSNIDKLVFIIYNRWGNKVFSAGNSSTCWDGTYNGRIAEAGSYTYSIKAITPCATIEKKGTVLLIR